MKSASGLPTFTVRKSAIHVPTSKRSRTERKESRHCGCRLSLFESRHPECRLPPGNKNQTHFEVGTSDADFRCFKVGIPCADFETEKLFYISEVGIPYADFTIHRLPYKSYRSRRQAARPWRLDSSSRWRPKAAARPF